ncbi:MAG: HAD family phosphatase [Acholeplasmatales bacterium]|nr:HAD family phosphatase [Acholeplasmatales bacterium]
MIGIVFDMDGVIFDTERIWRDAFIKYNKKYNIFLSEEYRKSICGKAEVLIRKELRDMNLNIDIDNYREDIRGYVNSEIEKGNYNIKDGFLDLIHYLKDKNYKIALATSSNRKRTNMLFKNKNLDINMFDYALCGDEVINGKPNPEIFIKACNHLGVDKKECYVIEDSINGIMASIDGGLIPIMVIDMIEPNDYVINNCKYIFDNLDDIKSIL